MNLFKGVFRLTGYKFTKDIMQYIGSDELLIVDELPES